MIPDPAERPTLTIEETAVCLGIGRTAAYEAARRGDIPTLRLGRRLLVPTAGLRRLLQLDSPEEEGLNPLGGLRVVDG